MSGTDELPDAAGAEGLLKAGAVLPPDAEGAGEHAVPLVARAYRHPGLDDRVVMRLVAEELLAAEDLAAGFLGLEPDGEAEVVGQGVRRSLGFPEWVLVHHPEDGHHALAVVPELERAARQAKAKPKAALDAYHELAGRLGAAVPHFLPTFYEQAGRVFVGEDNAQYAGQLFARARDAEARHGLAVDEDRLDAVFLEFALAGALPVKVLSAYAKELAARLPAAEALSRFTRLCLRRTAGGLPPSAQMAQDLRKLARAAGADADAQEQAYLAELIGLPATLRAPTGWWKAHGKAIAALGRRDPQIRATLLGLMPQSRDRELAGLWLEIIESSGGIDDLVAGQAPAGGVAGWLERFLAAREYAWGVPPHLPALLSVAERLAPRLRTELAEAGRGLKVAYEVDLIDLLLALDVPVADPGGHMTLRLEAWAGNEPRRDLLALAADTRFRKAFHAAAEGFHDNDDGQRAVRALAESPGGRPMLAEWMVKVARRSSAAGLPDLPAAMARLAWLPGRALALAEDEVREAAAADVAEVLARTLRTGLFDELGWPAWDEAVAHLVPAKDADDIVICDAWPYLIAAGPTQARVLGPDGAELTHDLRIPARDIWGEPGFHYVDGELLVYWRSRQPEGGLRGYWHTAPDRLHPIEGARYPRGTRLGWYHSGDAVALALPGGGRTTGHAPLHRGDTAVPEESNVISDGVSYWTWSRDGSDRETVGWYEFDPATGEVGRKSMPGFLADATRTAPDGSRLLSGWLLPAGSDAPTPMGAPVDGLLRWRVVELPDGSRRGDNGAGLTVTVPDGMGPPAQALLFPGAERPCALVRDNYRIQLVAADGTVTATARTDLGDRTFVQGTVILPPLRYWCHLRPRDPEGSAALRRVARDTAAALLKAADADGDDLPAQIRALLPGVTHDALVAGIAGVTAHAATQQRSLHDIAARLTEALAGDRADDAPLGPSDHALSMTLGGLGGYAARSWHGRNIDGAFRQIRAIGQALESRPEPVEGVRHHFQLPQLEGSDLRWDRMLDHPEAIAYRAATTDESRRAPLRALLGELHDHGLPLSADPARWRRMSLRLDKKQVALPDGGWRSGTWLGLLPLGGGAFAALVSLLEHGDFGAVWTALVHDPAGRFEVPAPYTVRSSSPVGSARPAGWTEAFLAELDARGAAPWRPEAAAEFARLTGVSPTVAKLVVAGLPNVDSWGQNFLTKEERAALGVKLADAAMARDQLRALDADVRRAVLGALLPDDPAALWTHGPDVDAAAAVWLERVGRQVAVPEWLLAEVGRALRTGPDAVGAVRSLIDPAGAPEMSKDLAWAVSGDRARPVDGEAVGFTGTTLFGTLSTAAWLAHRLPAGDPIRAALPGALAAVRDRLANPDLLLDLNRYIDLPSFRKAAGAPTETGDGYIRYGCVVLATHDDRPSPAIRASLLDGDDPYLRALIGAEGEFPVEAALRTARDPRFAALLADPGDPVAGERDADGTWWPQDPSRSVPELVAEVAGEHGLGADAAVLYLTLLAMPDPTDRNVARWTGWKSARLKAARAELAATDLVVEAARSRAGRALFLPGGWSELSAPALPVEQWKLPMFPPRAGMPLVPGEPVADLYARAWGRVRDGDTPRFEELRVRRGRRR